MKINGKVISQNENMTLEEVLKKEGFSLEKSAVELNGSIISKSRYKEIEISKEDVIEVVSFVGGG